MALIVAVAGVNVASATVTVALARRQEVAFLKSQGLPPEVVFWSLTGSGLLAGVLGAATGIAGGLAAALNINEIVAGLEAIATAVRRAAALLLTPGAGGPGAVTLIDRGFYLEQIPIDVELVPLCVVAGWQHRPGGSWPPQSPPRGPRGACRWRCCAVRRWPGSRGRRHREQVAHARRCACP